MGTKLGARHAWAMVWLVSGMAAIGQEALAAKPARGSGPGPARDVQWTELGDVVVDSDAAWAEGQYRATSLTVANGATLTVAGGATIEVAGVLSIGGNSTVRFEGKNTDAQVDGVWAGSGVTLAAGDVVIEAGSRLAADGSGYGPSSGPGYGGTAGGNGGGGSYGGWGGQMGDPGGAPYGSIEEPVDLGSGGGWGDGDGTPGGGAIRLSVTGALKVDGVISADGARVDGYRHGAGSGGSVWITVTGSLTGSGRISANGGATDWGSGTGGGGRVAIYAGSSLDTFGGTISAASGQLAREGTVGGAGTVYLKVADWPHGDLILDNAGRDAARLTPLLLNHTVRDLRLAHAAKAELTVAGDALAQTGTGELRVEAGTSLFVHNALTLGRVHVLAGGLLGGVAGSPNLTLTTAGDMVVDVDGKITVDGLGYGSGSGPGYGGSAGANGGGGSYGGWGGQMGDAGGAPYGSIEEPVAPGSGGGWGDGDGTPGGGVLRLVVGGALRVDGVVSADGARVGGPRPGAGSGGSVWITVTGSLTGTGRVSANGGAADWGSGTGGGGRVAIYFGSSLDTFAGTISAAGGQLAREGTGGGAGTVYLKAADWPHGDLVLDNAGQDAERLTPLVLSQTVRDLRLAHRAEAELTATGDAAILTGAGELSVSPGCRLLVHGGVVFGRAHVFGGATVTHLAGERGFLLKTNGDFVLDSGGLITADALGYGAGTGPGYGGTSGGYHGGGGSYGGWGGQMGDRGGVLYGSAEEPEDFGSGGGWGEGPGGAGGGAIRLIVARALQMDGTITANGETTGNRRGAGSGGSVWITVTGGLTGSGTVTANGGSSGWGAGAGGGGRVCVEAGRMSGTWSAHADGGNGGSESPGGSGGSVVIRYAERLEVAAQNFSAAAGAGNAPPESVPGVSQTAQQVGLRWVRPKHWLLHGVANLAWIALGENEVGASVTDVSAYGNGFRTPIASNLPLYAGVVSWDTTEVVDGLYEVRIITANLNGTASEGRQVFVVNNSAHWHGGSLDADQTWTADAVHVVESDVTIPAGITLTVQPGAVVKFAPGVSLTVATGGTLSAPATADGHVVFTALSDDSAGGDTNLDGASSWPFAGWWPGLIGAGGTIGLSDYAEVRYAVPVVVDRALPGNTTWYPWTLYRIRGSITVPGGVALTVLPGTVVKFEANASLEIAAGGSLVAQGAVAQPIVFTSIKDDAVGGDTDADAGQNPPFAGDWQWLHTSGGTITLDHATISYGGSVDTCGMVHVDSGGTATIRNSFLRASLYEGAMLDNGSMELTNCVLTDADRMVQTNNGTLRLVNCTIDRAITLGALAHGGALEMVNCIMANCPTAINECCGSPASVIRHSDFWNCNPETYPGRNGNLSADPKFWDAARRDYRLDYVSPCIDAGDTPAAPVSDALGAPRYDDPRTPNTGVPDAEAHFADLGAFEFVESAAAAVDLVVRSVSGPLNAEAGSHVSVGWEIVNAGSAPAVGPWHDTVSLVPIPGREDLPVLTSETVLSGAGVVLGPGDTCRMTARVLVPGGLVGNYRFQIEANSSGDIFEGQNRANNAGASQSPVALDLPELVLDGPALERAFVAGGTAAYWFKVIPPAGKDAMVTLTRSAVHADVGLYAARGYVPWPWEAYYDVRELTSDTGTTTLRALVPAVADSTEYCYVQVYCRALGASAAQPFSISARELDFEVVDYSPKEVLNSGEVTFYFVGGGLTESAVYELTSDDGTQRLDPLNVERHGTTYAAVTFDLSSLPQGGASLSLRDTPRSGPGQRKGEVVHIDVEDYWDRPAGYVAAVVTGPGSLRVGETKDFRARLVAAGLTFEVARAGVTVAPSAIADGEVSGGISFYVYDIAPSWTPEPPPPPPPPGYEPPIPPAPLLFPTIYNYRRNGGAGRTTRPARGLLGERTFPVTGVKKGKAALRVAMDAQYTPPPPPPEPPPPYDPLQNPPPLPPSSWAPLELPYRGAHVDRVSLLEIEVVQSEDPNDKYGPSGTGPERFITPGTALRYTVLFENKPEASASAATVVVTDRVDPAKVDLDTFALGNITFGDVQITPPEGLSSLSMVWDLRSAGKDLMVGIDAGLDFDTGEITWRITSLDPLTRQAPRDPLAGFLPPNVKAPEGEGSVSYSVLPKTESSTGTRVGGNASIVFDYNAPIATPEWVNTIDAGAPVSRVEALPPVTATPDFTVRWGGHDDQDGSGIAAYYVHVSDNGRGFSLWQPGTAATEEVYHGEPGHIYRFLCVARDSVGNLGSLDAQDYIQATTIVPFPLPTIRDLILGRTTKAPEQLVFADVNQDGRVDVADLVRWEVLASGRAGTGARFATGPQLSLVPLEVMPGFPATLEVRLDGSDQSYAGVNAQLLLPPGVAATAANPGPLLAGPGATADFEPFGLPDMEHGLTIVAYSTHQAPAGPRGDGVLVTLDLAVAADLAQGTYPVSFASPRREVTIEPYAALASADGLTSIRPATSAGTITVLPPDSDNDGLPDLFEKKIIDADPNDAITGIADVRPGDDFDGDGSTNLLESQQSTDPTAFQWAWHMTVTGAYAPYLELGLAAGALPGWDALDQDTLPVPPEGNGSVYSTQDSLALKRDVRPPAPEVDWLIVAAAGSADVALTWSPAGVMPPGKYLSLYEVDAQRRPVATGSLDLGVSSTLQVAAGETRLFRIHYGADLVVPLRLQPGWNLISLPVAPRDPRPAALFRSASEGRGEDRGALFAGDVWGWRGGRYQAATEIEPLRGYWVYCQAEATVLVHGTRLTTARFVLDPGWNLLGPQIDRAVPGGIASPFECCVWDPAAGRYVATAYLQVGRGHWLVSPSAGTIDLGPVGP